MPEICDWYSQRAIVLLLVCLSIQRARTRHGHLEVPVVWSCRVEIRYRESITLVYYVFYRSHTLHVSTKPQLAHSAQSRECRLNPSGFSQVSSLDSTHRAYEPTRKNDPLCITGIRLQYSCTTDSPPIHLRVLLLERGLETTMTFLVGCWNSSGLGQHAGLAILEDEDGNMERM